MLKKVFPALLFFCLSASGQQQAPDLVLAKQVLSETDRVMSAITGVSDYHHSEVLAFNLIYRNPGATVIFKEIYQRGQSAGKFYALIGLYLKKDPDFEQLKTEFLNSLQEPVYCQYGCKASTNNDVKQVLNAWLEGIPNKLWYAEIVIAEQSVK